VVAGLAGLYGAEIRELPDVDRPVITVTTNFSGASPETVDRELTAIIEGAVARGGRRLDFLDLDAWAQPGHHRIQR
jgi:multidrug efflux pump subunit AcrB